MKLGMTSKDIKIAADFTNTLYNLDICNWAAAEILVILMNLNQRVSSQQTS